MANRPDENAKVFAALMVLALPVVPFQGYFGAAERTSSVTYWCLANLALAPLVLFALLGLHQTAMAAAAYALGDRVTSVTIGIGPALWPRHRATSNLVIRLFPVTYRHAILTARADGQRRRTALIYLVGALAIVAFVALLFVCKSFGWRSMRAELGQRLAPDVMAVYFAALPVYYSLLALLGSAGARGFGMSPALLQARRIRGATMFASMAYKRGAHREALAIARGALEEVPQDALLGVLVAELLVAMRDPTAMEVIEQLRQRQAPGPLRNAITNLWAWEAYMRNDLTLRDEACDLIERIVSGTPGNDLSLVDTHAHMLLWSGRDSAAEPKFVQVEASTARASSRASSACGLAMLHVRRGDYATSRRWLARARELDHTNMLIAPTAHQVEAPGTERL